jgi:hypothetical protein
MTSTTDLPVQLVKSDRVSPFPARPPSFATTPETLSAQLFNSAANHLDNALFLMRRDWLAAKVRAPLGVAGPMTDFGLEFAEGYLTEIGIAWASLRHAEALGRG